MTEPTIQPEPCPRDFCTFDIIVLYIDLSTSSKSLYLIILSAFEFEYKVVIVVTNLELFIQDFLNFIQDFLIVESDSVL